MQALLINHVEQGEGTGRRRGRGDDGRRPSKKYLEHKVIRSRPDDYGCYLLLSYALQHANIRVGEVHLYMSSLCRMGSIARGGRRWGQRELTPAVAPSASQRQALGIVVVALELHHLQTLTQRLPS